MLRKLIQAAEVRAAPNAEWNGHELAELEAKQLTTSATECEVAKERT